MLLRDDLLRDGDSRDRRRRKLAWIPWFLGSAAVLALSVLASYNVLSGRSSPPHLALEGAREARDEARRAAAPAWASGEMVRAEAAWTTAVLELRKQETSFVLLRNFTGARDALKRAEQSFQRATAESNRRRTDARAEAEAAIAEAAHSTARSVAFADSMHLGLFERTMLGRSKVALAEGRALLRAGSYAEARDRAKLATSQSKVVTARAVAAASRFTDSALVAGWRRMVDDTISWSRKTGGVAIVVLKENHRLTVYDNGKAVRTFFADMGYKSVNDKLHAGDSATPEGRYTVTAKKGLGKSTYYKALLLDYPNAEDRANFDRMKKKGRIPKSARLGGMIEIHGEGGRGKDWTRGCVAVTNSDMDALFTKVGVGTPVTIVGGDGKSGMFTELVRQNAPPAAERSQ
jgi:hypothetical protein